MQSFTLLENTETKELNSPLQLFLHMFFLAAHIYKQPNKREGREDG